MSVPDFSKYSNISIEEQKQEIKKIQTECMEMIRSEKEKLESQYKKGEISHPLYQDMLALWNSQEKKIAAFAQKTNTSPHQNR